jgi:hypothetical protein
MLAFPIQWRKKRIMRDRGSGFLDWDEKCGWDSQRAEEACLMWEGGNGLNLSQQGEDRFGFFGGIEELW